jgi:hypothetical protein
MWRRQVARRRPARAALDALADGARGEDRERRQDRQHVARLLADRGHEEERGHDRPRQQADVVARRAPLPPRQAGDSGGRGATPNADHGISPPAMTGR